MGFRNPFWDSKPELFSDIACLRIPYQPCIVVFGKKFSGTHASNRRELRLHLKDEPTATGVFRIRVVSPRKVSRFAPLNHYYIIIDEVFFDNFLVIIYLLVVCKNNNNSFILVYFNYLFISCIQKKKKIIHFGLLLSKI